MNWDDDSGWVYEDEDTRFNTVDEDRDEDALDPDDENLYDRADRPFDGWDEMIADGEHDAEHDNDLD
jgi:hypothetical protein